MSLLQNTKILPPSIEIPSFIKIIGKILQFISPNLATMGAMRLFETPIDYPTPKREKMMAKSAQHKTLAIPTINKTVHILSYGYSKKKVLLCHGWAGRSTQLFMVADKLLENGYMVFSFDAPAHAKSSGKKTNMIEYIETIKTIHKEFGPFEAAVGHSFGGMAILNTQAEQPIFKKLVSIGAADLVSGIIKRFVENLELQPKIATKMQRNYEKDWKIKVDDFSGSHNAKNISVPALIVHDAKDGDVPVSCAEKIRLNLQNGRLLITNGLGHTKILRDKTTMNIVATFITQEV